MVETSHTEANVGAEEMTTTWTKKERKRKKNKRRKHDQRLGPELTVVMILDWADRWFKRSGHFPHRDSGGIPGSMGEKWRNVDAALHFGLRGFPGGSSLAQLLAEQRGKRNHKRLPALTVPLILRWADEYHRTFKKWPNRASGSIDDSGGETWHSVDSSLKGGFRHLPGGSSLAQLLAAHRGVRNRRCLPRLTHQQILAWADDHHARNGVWPAEGSGPVPAAAGETWRGVDMALRLGYRGLLGRSSLRKLLVSKRGVRQRGGLPF